jgi:hypothetical protein
LGGGIPNSYFTPTVTITPTLAGDVISITLVATNQHGSGTVVKNSIITVNTPAPTPEPDAYGAPTAVNGYNLGGSHQVIVGGNTYGGGAEYPTYTAGVAAGGYAGGTITTRAGLLAALSVATSGAVIYINPGSSIVMNDPADENILIPAGVTLASNRGKGSGPTGSTGGLISTTKVGSNWNKPLFRTNGDGVRITGLRMQGECYAEDYSGTESNFRVGVWCDGHAGFVVDNCDFKGFAYANIMVVACPVGAGRPYIHHNYIHESHNEHEGYGVDVDDGDCLIEGNIFYHNRHHITGDGKTGEYYTFRYNIMQDNTMATVGRQAMDVHQSAADPSKSGQRYDIYNNTILSGTACAFHCTAECIGEGHFLHNNIFYVQPSGAGYQRAVAFTYTTGSRPTKIVCTNNKWALPGGTLTLYPTNTGILEFQLPDNSQVLV